MPVEVRQEDARRLSARSSASSFRSACDDLDGVEVRSLAAGNAGGILLDSRCASTKSALPSTGKWMKSRQGVILDDILEGISLELCRADFRAQHVQ